MRGFVDQAALFINLLYGLAELLGVAQHGAEFQHIEQATIFAHAGLAQDDRSLAFQADADGDQPHDWQGYRQGKDGQTQIEEALNSALLVTQGRRAQVQQGDAGELLDAGFV